MSLLDLLNEPGSRPGEHKMYGVYPGIVTNNNDPNGQGRVKVRFPWREATDESVWARMVSLMAGHERGCYFLPEVNDEVLVAFEHGDLNYPYVLGMLWNGKDKPPVGTDQQNNIRMIKSRSGHEIILDDSSGQERIEIKDKSGDHTITIDSGQNAISIQSKGKLTLKAQTIEIEADSQLTLKGGAGVEVSSSATLTIKGALVQIN